MAKGRVEVTENRPQIVETDDSVEVSITETRATVVESPVGLQGPGGLDDKHFVHNQTTPSDEWVIAHNLDKKPSVTVVDSADNQWQAEVEYVDQDNIIVRTQAPFSGKAYLN